MWLGDFAYVSRSERPNYLKLLKNPLKHYNSLPGLAFQALLTAKYWLSLFLKYEASSKRVFVDREEKGGQKPDSDAKYFTNQLHAKMSWEEYLSGGIDVLPPHLIDMGFQGTLSDPFYQKLV